MNIGIIVYSQTGNTYAVASRLKDKLTTAGHTVALERLQTEGEVKPGAKEVVFKELPDISGYEAVVFGSPVQAFSLSLAMKSYLEQVQGVNGKRVAFLVTQHFPYPWMGGNRAIRQFMSSSGVRGAVLCGTGIVNWSRRGRVQQIEQVVESLCQSLATRP